MLRLHKTRMSSKEYAVEQNGVQVASLRRSRWRDSGEIAVQETHLSVHRRGMMKDVFKLKSGGSVLAEVRQDKPLRHDLSFDYGEQSYKIRRTGWLRKVLMVESNGQVIGNVTPRGHLVSTAIEELPSEWPVPIKVFLMWIALVLWDREDAAWVASR